jgi:hypothetical protein
MAKVTANYSPVLRVRFPTFRTLRKIYVIPRAGNLTQLKPTIDQLKRSEIAIDKNTVLENDATEDGSANRKLSKGAVRDHRRIRKIRRRTNSRQPATFKRATLERAQLQLNSGEITCFQLAIPDVASVPNPLNSLDFLEHERVYSPRLRHHAATSIPCSKKRHHPCHPTGRRLQCHASKVLWQTGSLPADSFPAKSRNKHVICLCHVS